MNENRKHLPSHQLTSIGLCAVVALLLIAAVLAKFLFDNDVLLRVCLGLFLAGSVAIFLTGVFARQRAARKAISTTCPVCGEEGVKKECRACGEELENQHGLDDQNSLATDELLVRVIVYGIYVPAVVIGVAYVIAISIGLTRE